MINFSGAGEAAVDKVSGQRSAVMGFAILAGKVLMACCDESQDTHNANVKRALQVGYTCERKMFCQKMSSIFA